MQRLSTDRFHGFVDLVGLDRLEQYRDQGIGYISWARYRIYILCMEAITYSPYIALKAMCVTVKAIYWHGISWHGILSKEWFSALVGLGRLELIGSMEGLWLLAINAADR